MDRTGRVGRQVGSERERIAGRDAAVTRAVIFDMDGLLFDSEIYWERARRSYAGDRGCDWTNADELACKGKNSPEWALAIKQRCQLPESLPEIIAAVSDRMRDLYTEHLPLLPGAVQTVQQLASEYPLGLASSSPQELIEFALDLAGIRNCFSALASSDQVEYGKPSPDVFFLAARRLGEQPSNITVFEDSGAGIRAARAARMKVIAVPNEHYPPPEEDLKLADHVLSSLHDFQPDML